MKRRTLLRSLALAPAAALAARAIALGDQPVRAAGPLLHAPLTEPLTLTGAMTVAEPLTIVTGGQAPEPIVTTARRTAKRYSFERLGIETYGPDFDVDAYVAQMAKEYGGGGGAQLHLTHRDDRFATLLAARADAVPLLATAAWAPTTSAFYQWNRRNWPPIDQGFGDGFGPVGSSPLYERNAIALSYLGVRHGMRYADDRATVEDDALNTLIDATERSMIWANGQGPIHLADNVISGFDPAPGLTSYRGIAAQLSDSRSASLWPVHDRLTEDHLARVAEALRVDGRMRNFAKMTVILPTAIARRFVSPYMTQFGPLTIAPSDFMISPVESPVAGFSPLAQHGLVVSGDAQDFATVLRAPVIHWPLAVVSTAIESLMLLYHVPIVKAAERTIMLQDIV